jgi:hypothetical protein
LDGKQKKTKKKITKCSMYRAQPLSRNVRYTAQKNVCAIYRTQPLSRNVRYIADSVFQKSSVYNRQKKLSACC